MKKGLPSLNRYGQVGKHIARWVLPVLLAVWCSGQLHAQTPIIGTTECNCLAGTSLDDPNFGDIITISGTSGVSWSVVTSEGLFVPNSDPLMPLPDGTAVPELGVSGVYRLDAVRPENTAFTITLTDGSNNYDLTNRHFCFFPRTEIVGDMGSCIDSRKAYSLNIPAAQVRNVVWTVTGGLMIPQNDTMIQVVWPSDAGVGTVSVTGEAATNEDLTGVYCDFDESIMVNVMDEEPIVLACNNSLNITMGPSCEVNLRPSTFLQDMQFDDSSYDLILRDIDADTIIPTSTLNGTYLNKTIEVKVVHECSGNSCWGNILLEDKSIPELNCPDTLTVDCDDALDPFATGFPTPAGSTVMQIDENSFFIDGFDQCGGLTLDFYDEINSNLCVGEFASTITRQWQATDEAGNTETCTQVIQVRRATFDDLTFPPIYDDVLGATNGAPSLQACGNWPKDENGYPDPDFTGRPMGTFCLNVQVDYSDQLISGCSDQSYKIKRRWQVSDLCGSGQDTTYNQIITVADNEPPVWFPPEEFGVGTNTLSCDADIDVPPPNVIFECSGWDYQVSYKLIDDSNNPFSFSITDGVIRNADGTYTITNVPAGQDTVWVIYTLMDDCGNVTQGATEVGFVDEEEPVPVCDRYTFIAVNEDGIAFAGPSAFDDGSYDNCLLDSMDVRRMDSACGESDDWGPKVKFCCEDVGNTVMVALRVFDASGNSNQCMVEVQVQDNNAPVFTNKPQDVTINCTEDVTLLDRFGVAEAEDVCGVTVTESVDRSNSRCGEGQVVRTFTATDAFGNVTVCEQRITLTNLDPFFINRNNPNDSRDDVVWPRNYSTNSGCLAGGLEPEDLPAAFSTPQIFANSCSEVSVTHEDIVFQYVDGACYKILRQWTIIDFCQFNPFAPEAGGKWDYTQEIMVTNSTRPTILSGCGADDATITSAGNCRAAFSISATGSDDCTPADELTWSYTIDLDDNGTVDFSGSGSSFSSVLDFTSLRVEWTVEDQCGNTTTCDALYVIDDQKKPTPYCLNEIVTVIMEDDGQVEIWASDFDNGSFDDCSGVRVSFSADVNDTSMPFTCDDVSNGIEEMIPLEIWVTDDSGNQDFCTATLTLQDNSDVCRDTVGVIDTVGTGNRIAISGRVATEDSRPLDQVEVVITANLQEFPAYEMTDTEGRYAFSDLLNANDYMLEPVKIDDADKGVSTLDLVMIQRHILGMAQLSSPYKVIAADVNNSESVTGADVVALRKLILGITDSFENNDPWRFVDAGQVFDDPLRPFPFTERVGYQQAISDMTTADFVAIKIGDVNGSVDLGNVAGDESTSNRSSMLLDGSLTEDNGKQYLEVISSNSITSLAGMQFTIKYPVSGQIEAITSDVLNISDDNIGWASLQDGMMAVSWSNSQAVSISDGDILFKIELGVTKGGLPTIGDGLLDAEAYVITDDAVETVDVVYARGGVEPSIANRLYQNVPNPFDALTVISFEIAEAAPATLSIYDINGRLIYQVTDEYSAGLHSVTLDVDALEATGILYYQLDSGSYTASKKMVVIR